MHINEVSKRLYPRISRNPNFVPIFPGKKCGLSAGKYGTCTKETQSHLKVEQKHTTILRVSIKFMYKNNVDIPEMF